MGDNHLEEVVCLANDLTDGQMRQAEENLRTLDERAKKVTLKVKKTVKSLRAAAEKLDDVWAKHYIAHACGTSFGVIGGFLTVGGGIATLMTAGAASPLLMAGLSFGVTGASTNVIAKVLESLNNSHVITEANKDLKEANESIAKMKNEVEDLDKEVESYKLYMYDFAVYHLNPSLKFLAAFLYARGIVDVTGKKVATAGQVCVQATVKVTAETTANGVKAATETMTEASAEGLAKVCGQTADDVVQAGAKTGCKTAGKVIIGLGVAMLMWDAIDLGFTINDLVKNKGSEAAKHLREKADELEALYNTSQ